MTSIWVGRRAQARGAPLSILLLDTRPTIGAKILMSGGTRCNVTNQEVKPSDFQGGPRHFVKHIFEAFTPQETVRWFKEIGVEIVLEPGGKYFPVTHSAKTVLEALMKEADRVGVILKTGIRITEITKEDERFHLKSADGAFAVSARKVVLTTGGLSYPTTGSDGTGYKIAESFGHKIVNTFPALTPLLTNDSDWKSLSGISLDARLTFFRNGKKTCQHRDSFLFTHFGFSGPAALNISRHLASAKREDHPQIEASFLPDETSESLKTAFQSAEKKSPEKFVKNLLIEEFSLPARFVETFLKKVGLSQKQLARFLLHYPLEVEGVFGYKKAEVTAGGVDLKEVTVATMESKLVHGLYFAGEILDVDGRIGGFNFQWAWSTGAVAGRSAAASLIP
jgi:predicted Rossmann fold flavoprotein